jgi:hypothetical protein
MVNFPLLVLVVSFAGLVLAALAGDVARKRFQSMKDESREDSGVVLGGVLTLLGLIIGFSFSMAINRYDLRKDYEKNEANAIAAQDMRADLLTPEDAVKVHELLKQYLDQRVLFYTTRDLNRREEVIAEIAHLQDELWSAVRSGAGRLPPQLQGILISGMTDVVLAQRSTQAAWGNRIPTSAWVMILVTSLGCNVLIGYRARRTDWIVYLVMPVAVSVSLFLISDLDSPRGGTIRVVPHNLISLSQSLHGQQQTDDFNKQ